MEKYIIDNYEENFKIYCKYCYKKYGKKLRKNDLEDIFNDSILSILTSKAYLSNNIKDYNGYFWIVLRNRTVKHLKDRNINVKIGGEIISVKIFDIDNINSDEEFSNNISKLLFNIQLEEDFEYMRFQEDMFEKLIEKSKTILDAIEYKIFINHIYNDLSYRDIAEIIGYSIYTVYLKNMQIVKKIKKELEDNKDEYFSPK